jgi:hypothetical protein
MWTPTEKVLVKGRKFLKVIVSISFAYFFYIDQGLNPLNVYIQ